MMICLNSVPKVSVFDDASARNFLKIQHHLLLMFPKNYGQDLETMEASTMPVGPNMTIQK
jgi:hypothetical protein